MIPRHLIIGMSAMLIVVLLMSVYVWRMRTRVVELHPSSADTRAVAPPVTGRTEQVTLFVAYDDSGILRPQSARIPLPAGRQQRAEELLRALVDIYLGESAPHRLARGAEVRNVYLVNPGLAVIDTDSAFADGHRSGILEEELTVASLVETLSANIPGITRVKILVDGKERETLAGHADLSGFYDVSAVGKMAEQMQSASQ
jgi:Sporulation and spore germination